MGIPEEQDVAIVTWVCGLARTFPALVSTPLQRMRYLVPLSCGLRGHLCSLYYAFPRVTLGEELSKTTLGGDISEKRLLRVTQVFFTIVSK